MNEKNQFKYGRPNLYTNQGVRLTPVTIYREVYPHLTAGINKLGETADLIKGDIQCLIKK